MKTSKKILAVLFTVVTLFTSFAFTLSASASSVPTVYVPGQGLAIRNKDGKVIYENGRVPLPDGLLEVMVDELVPLFAKAIMLNQWSEYREKVLEYWEPIYDEIRLDKNGENTNGSYRDWSWNPDTIAPNFLLGSYLYYQDWRLDPFASAAELNEFIQAVKAKTGSSKVNLIGRCEGCNVIMAYLAEYGYDDVNCVEFYVSSALGIDSMGALFSGQLKFDPVMLKQFYDERLSMDDDDLTVFLDATVEYLVESYGFENTCKMLEKSLPKIYKEVGFDILLTSYGSFPGMWSCVGPQYYEKARKDAFAGREDEYAGLIEKIDNYDVKVRQRYNEIIAEGMAAGVKFANFVKYGEYIPNTPLCAEMYDLCDNAVSIKYSAFDATATKRNEQFSDDYLKNADPEYISPDKRIDMSTSILKDTTWVIYNSDHNDFNNATNILMKAWLDSDGTMTVHSDPSRPQFLTCVDGNTLRPMNAEDVPEGTFDSTGNKGRFGRLIKKFFNFIKQLFSFLKKMR